MRFEIAFFVPGMPFQGDTLERESLGGSETAALCVARELARRDHSVRVFSNTTRPGIYDGVAYHPLATWPDYAMKTPHDVAVVQRAPEALAAQYASKLNFLWCHDLGLGRQQPSVRGAMWNVDRLLVVSEFMRQQYKTAYDLPDHALYATRNGIDLDLLKPRADDLPVNRKQLVYAARPERGLDVLLERIMPRLLERDPELRLIVAGYANNPEHMAAFYAHCNHLAAALPEGVATNKGSLTKVEYYRLLRSSGCYVYPTPSPQMPDFAEVSCISAMEAQGSGLPIVTSDAGALRETIAPGAGRLIRAEPTSEGYIEQFVDAVLGYVNGDDTRARASRAGLERAATLGWDGVAKDWEDLIERVIDETNTDHKRLAVHFIRRSDVEAATAAAETSGDPRFIADVKTYTDTAYGFMASDEAFTEYYAENGTETTTRLRSMEATDWTAKFNETDEDRFKAIERIIGSDPAIERVIDYGCGHGWSTIYLHNKLGREWLGVDIDPGAVEWARDCAKKYAKTPDKIAFARGDHTMLDAYEGQFDAAVCSEVLEHVRDPYAVIEAVERTVKKGGWIVVTVPWGPVEFGTANWFGFRNHIREYWAADLKEMFGAKKMILNFVAQPPNAVTGEPQGFWLLQYKADHQPVGRIDMARKLRYQRPRQTISACIIAGGSKAEEHLHASLRSYAMIADQVIVADCGMSAEAKRIVAEYPAVVVPGLDPRTHGFDMARNTALSHAVMDWVMWVDTDEVVINPHGITKYMRDNIFDGYSVRQYHFAVDTQFPPDMPVRLFRRVQRDGVKPRWFGGIHEHPERALNEGPGTVIILADVSIAHPGYVHESVRRERFQRNLPLLDLDRRRYPERLLQKHFICRDNMIVVGHAMQRNGGQLTPELKKLCEEVVETAQKHFIGKTTYHGVDSLIYYSQALQVLGRGFQATVDLKLERGGQALPGDGPKSYWFASVADLKAELNKRAEAAGPLEQKWW